MFLPPRAPCRGVASAPGGPPGRQRALSSADPGPAQQAVRAGERVRAQEPQAAAAPAAEHERARGGAGAAADPLREGGRGLGWAGSGRGRGQLGSHADGGDSKAVSETD